MEISSVGNQYVLNQANETQNINKSVGAEEVSATNTKNNAITDKVTISGDNTSQVIMEQNIDSNNVQPNQAALLHMNPAEAGEFGSATLDEKMADTMKTIAMTQYLASMEEMNLPSEQVPDGSPFVDTDSLNQANGIDVTVKNKDINININVDENTNQPKPQQTGPAQELGINVE